nr:hypothetical protein [Evansella caseinilytica]
MGEENKNSNYKISTGGYKLEEKGLQPANVTNIGKPPLGGSNVKRPTNKKQGGD